MGTISRMFSSGGYCEVDSSNVVIEIEYVSIPFKGTDDYNRVFHKQSNHCYYLKKGKCNKNEKCAIFENADTEIIFDLKTNQIKAEKDN